MVIVGVTTIDIPALINEPPQLPVYHFHGAPAAVPRPVIDKVEEDAEHIEYDVAVTVNMGE